MTGKVNGTDNQELSDGSHVDFSSKLVVILEPETGYEVGTITGQTPVYTDEGNGATTDDMACTITNVQENKTTTPVWTQIPTYTLTLSATEIDNEGAHGTIFENVTRKGLTGYTQSDVSGSTRPSAAIPTWRSWPWPKTATFPAQ